MEVRLGKILCAIYSTTERFLEPERRHILLNNENNLIFN